MVATNYTFQCEQGASFDEVVIWKNSAGVAINNTGYTARMQIRREPDSSIIAELTTANNKIELGGANGEIQLVLSAAETAALAAGDYLYDLELVSAGGSVSRIVEGVFSVIREITKG